LPPSTGTPTIRQFYYQLCNEFGQNTCEPGDKGCAEGVQPMPPPTVFAPIAHGDLTQPNTLCIGLYNVTRTAPALWSNRQRGWTNVAHGGRDLRASSILFVNGRNDPYSSVSVLPEQLSFQQAMGGLRSVAIANASHCAGMERTSSADPPELAAAKAEVGKAVRSWLALEA
jgi:hypothetical protein